eukprot:CAMPEP_0174315568 /NCGR_PEP_ID=MMETSP0810-20121108/6367_1 /TAXON_ID=73025 ORGANISM="Eutreptiella gymnastica-like, Strain CCMP1594" /NCGR_SAMPLE_ID=MMETSP0810 /ASSEMBLY_ACC=CAM_ASM_000659 /LENGTH=133 /DNA_ID=CAMNT_0015424985 /DNA_START=69 /DNA_END=466 /DNA_ORIENTATION=-
MNDATEQPQPSAGKWRALGIASGLLGLVVGLGAWAHSGPGSATFHHLPHVLSSTRVSPLGHPVTGHPRPPRYSHVLRRAKASANMRDLGKGDTDDLLQAFQQQLGDPKPPAAEAAPAPEAEAPALLQRPARPG